MRNEGKIENKERIFFYEMTEGDEKMEKTKKKVGAKP
jgi:hypothetical protein